MTTPDLDSLLLEVLKRFKGLPVVRVDWVDLDEVDPLLFAEEQDWACCFKTHDGAYCIGVHPRLRRAPLYVLRFLLFHEVLHVALPGHGKCVHHKAFRVAERLWPDYERANRWLDDPNNW